MGELGFLGAYTGFIYVDNPDPERWTGLKITTDKTSQNYHAADADQDQVVGDFELLNYIDRWVAREVGDFELLDCIDLWAARHYYWDSTEGKFKPGNP